MAGTYKCIVVGIGGQNNGTGTLDVYCKYYEENYILKIFILNSHFLVLVLRITRMKGSMSLFFCSHSKF